VKQAAKEQEHYDEQATLITLTPRQREIARKKAHQWPSETHEDREYRRRRLRDFGARPYPMPYTRTPELIGFQRWVVGAYDKRVPWRDWIAAKYEPRGLRPAPTFPLFECLP
jgi:hypothetical protein